MQLFINKGVCERKWNGNVKIENGSSLQLLIPNYLEKEQKYEYIKFIFPKCKESYLAKDFLIKNITLVKLDKKAYHITKTKKHDETYMYALLRSNDIVPDDIYIPANMKDKVEVLRRIRFWDSEVDYGEFLSNVYLVRIKLDLDESIPMYLTCRNPWVLMEHYVFYRLSCDEKYYVTAKSNTYIRLNENNKHQYISLSSLCE